MKFKILIICTSILLSLLASCSSDNSDISFSKGDFESTESSYVSLNASDVSQFLSEDVSETSDRNSDDASEFNSHYNISEDISAISSDVTDNSECSAFISDNASLESVAEPDTSENINSEHSDNSIELSSEDASSKPFFDEPAGVLHTTENGNSFETNCTDENALNIMAQIADIASEYNKVTVYYTDVEQKHYFAYGADLTHNTASTIKAPYAVFLLKKGVDLNEKLTMEKQHVFTGSGVLKNKPVGSVFSVKELIKYMITRSDNTAYAMLLDRFGTKGFTEYADSIGVDFKIPSGGYTTCKIREMATFMLDIYKYKDTDPGAMLIDYMKSCSYSLQIPKSTKYPVAHKFGFIYEGKAFHDMGIVFAPSPYIELIFTKIDGTVYDTGAFLKIGGLVEELNQALSDEY